jgi:2-hydroxychromene-2-carboxylate isomerase
MADDNALTFYFDFVSPYAYLAWKQIQNVAARHRRTLIVKPILFAALLNHHGQKGPAEIPAKRIYTFKNVIRMAHFSGLSITPPAAHPFNPLLALRASSVPMAESARLALIDAIFDVTWQGAKIDGSRDVTDPKTIAALATNVGLDGAKVLEAASSQEMKDRVRIETENAIAQGAFGVPTMIADGELFWGADSIPHLEAYLRGEDPANRERLNMFTEIPVGATRQRSPS